MKFKKLDDKTVCCMVSTEDLSDNNITIEDFIQNKDKVQDFLEEVVEAAKEEVGFETSGPMLSIQIMAMYPGRCHDYHVGRTKRYGRSHKGRACTAQRGTGNGR